jgi:elongation factor G
MAAPPESTRNIAFSGHSTCGKTTLIESLLHKSGAIQRRGSVGEGTTVCDFDPASRQRQHSIDLACAFLEHKGVQVNLIDTPGYRDFVGQIYCAVAAVECLALVVDADDGVRPNTRKVWKIAEAASLPCIVIVNRCDREHARPLEVLQEIQEQLSARALPLTLPVGTGPDFTGVEPTLKNDSGSDAAKAAGEKLLETVVESSDELMERYLGGEALAPEEIDRQLVAAVTARAVFPVLFTSAEKDLGVPELLDVLVTCAPPASNPRGRTFHLAAKPEEKIPVRTGVNDPFCGLVFKVVADPYVGKLSYLRVFSGSIAHNGTFVNPHTGKTEKVGKLVRLQGKEHHPIEAASAGAIVALLKLESLKNFDLLTGEKQVVFDRAPLPTPMFSRAVQPKSKADEKKFAEAIVKVMEEDVMIRPTRDKQTGEMVVAGTSSLHLQVLWDRLKSRYGVEVTTKEPKTPYLETIAGRGDAQYRHKKQTGGAGEFAEVWLRVEPRERGAGVEFVNSVFGGAISGSYVGSAEKGVRSVMERGVIAGCPVVDVRVDIYDGKEHPVDSKDIAFQKAGREAFKLAMQQAKPVLLEPIVHLEVTFPMENMGDIQGDLNRRRGRVIGMDSEGEFQTLKAEVPLSELSDYASSLGSVTGGQGMYSIDMSHYEVVPGNIQQKVCEAAKAEMQKED